MTDFDKILIISNRLVNKLLKEARIGVEDINDNSISDEDKIHIVNSLQEVDSIDKRNSIIKKLSKESATDWKQIKQHLHKPTSKINHLQFFGKVAATLLVALSVGYFTYNTVNLSNNDVIDSEAYANEVVLYMPNGKIKALTSSELKPTIGYNIEGVGKLEKDTLVYSLGAKTKFQMHKLSVPYGKTFTLVLADGTRVFLNSGSSIKYPDTFSDIDTRTVELDGEAYFEVTKNREKPFVVQADKLNVRVLGTKFVMSSYLEDENAQTILLEGSVALYKSKEKYQSKYSSMLQPGQIGELVSGQDTFEIRNVDTNLYTGWLEGRLILNHLPFPMILKKLERHFNCSIENKNRELEKQIFTANFENEDIDAALSAFQKNFPFEYIKVDNNKIIIKP